MLYFLGSTCERKIRECLQKPEVFFSQIRGKNAQPGTPFVSYFLGNFTPKTSNYCLKNRALGFPGRDFFHLGFVATRTTQKLRSRWTGFELQDRGVPGVDLGGVSYLEVQDTGCNWLYVGLQP